VPTNILTPHEGCRNLRHPFPGYSKGISDSVFYDIKSQKFWDRFLYRLLLWNIAHLAARQSYNASWVYLSRKLCFPNVIVILAKSNTAGPA